MKQNGNLKRGNPKRGNSKKDTLKKDTLKGLRVAILVLGMLSLFLISYIGGDKHYISDETGWTLIAVCFVCMVWAFSNSLSLTAGFVAVMSFILLGESSFSSNFFSSLEHAEVFSLAWKTTFVIGIFVVGLAVGGFLTFDKDGKHDIELKFSLVGSILVYIFIVYSSVDEYKDLAVYLDGKACVRSIGVDSIRKQGRYTYLVTSETGDTYTLPSSSCLLDFIKEGRKCEIRYLPYTGHIINIKDAKGWK